MSVPYRLVGRDDLDDPVSGDGGHLLRLALDAVQMGTWELDLETGHAIRSRQHDRIFGYDETLPWTYEIFLDHIHPEHRDAIDASLAEAVASRSEWSFEGRIIRSDGEVRWIWARGVPSGDGPMGGTRYIGGVIDITERREAEEALRESEARYRSLFQSIDQGFALCEMLVDETGLPVDYRFLEVNEAFGEMTGIRPAAEGRTARDLVPGLEDRWVELYARVGLGRETLRFEEGSAVMGRWFEVLAVPRGQRRFVILFKDVTGRRRTEEALRRSEEHARLAIAVARLGTWAYDPSRDAITLDERMRSILGLADEAAETALSTVMERVHGDDRARVGAAVRTALDPSTSGEYAIEYRVLRQDGSERWVAVNGQAQFAGEGQDRTAHALVGTALDVTEHKEAEAALRENEARLRTALAVKDEFLGLVSHELRTPMTVVLGMSRLLANRALDGDGAAEVATDIVESAEALNRLVESMLLLARLDRDEAAQHREPTMLHRSATKVVDGYRARLTPERLVLEIRDRQTLVEVPGQWLEQVIDNLVGNAVKYSDPDRPITVLVEGGEDEVLLRVLDGGPGLSDVELAHVFEPFYRAPGAQARAGGVGLGLAVCKRIIESLDGRVWARGRREGGVEFGFALPRMHAPDD